MRIHPTAEEDQTEGKPPRIEGGQVVERPEVESRTRRPIGWSPSSSGSATSSNALAHR